MPRPRYSVVIAPSGRTADVVRAAADAAAQCAAGGVQVVVAATLAQAAAVRAACPAAACVAADPARPARWLAHALDAADGALVAPWDPGYRHHPDFLATLAAAADASPGGAALADRLELERGALTWADLAAGRAGGDGGLDARTLVYPRGPERPEPNGVDPLRALFHAVARRGPVAALPGRGYLVVAPGRSRHAPLRGDDYARRRPILVAALAAYAGPGTRVSIACAASPSSRRDVQLGADS